MHRDRERPELLAPAGDWEALRAAALNGADAVYFGLSNFNARARAANFAPEELPEVMRYLHSHNVKGFVTLNTLIFSDELPAVVEFVKRCAVCGVDAVIVQDLGLVALIKRIAPTLPLHASTQMTLSEPGGIAFIRDLGVERVVLARELSLDDIRKVTATVSTPVEVFVHGALCVAYSGQCLTSEALGGRSANRGQCAQACRLPYEMLVDGVARDLGDRAYLLSPQDLAAYDLIAPLIDAGVISFKIEGRLKGGPYVASTTQTYRKAIDSAVEARDFHLSRREELELAQTFSRGLTPGFLEGVNHQKLVRGRFPKSRGIRIGTVAAVGRGAVRVELCEPFENLVKPGDGLLFDIGKPETVEPGGRVWRVTPLAATRSPRRGSREDAPLVELQFETGTLDLSRIPLGCDVYRTDDPALRKRLEHSYVQDRVAQRVPLTARLNGELGGSLILTLTDDANHTATTAWPGPLELARKQPTMPADIRDQIARLGDTPFDLGELVVELPEGVIVPRSVLNDLRRRAASELAERRLEMKRHAIKEPDALERMRSVLSSRQLNRGAAASGFTSPLEGEVGGASPPGGGEGSPHPDASPPTRLLRGDLPLKGGGEETALRLTVLVRSFDQLDAVLAWTPSAGLARPAAIYCDFEDLRRYKDAVPRARAAGIPIGLAPLRILKPGEDGFQALVARAQPDIVLVRNLASIGYFRDHLPQARLIGDFSLNVANELTADLLIRAGLERLVPSFDLNWEQLAAMVRRCDPDWFEPVIHQHMPMFHTEYCVFAATLSTGTNHTNCGRPCDRHRIELRDRAGAEFPVHPDTGCRNTVYNAVPQSGAEYVRRMLALGLSRFRIDLLRETPAQVGVLLNRYAMVVGGLEDGRDTWKRLRAMNQLGVTRGSLQML